MNTKTKKATPKSSTKTSKAVPTAKTKTVKATANSTVKATPKAKKSNRVTVSVVQYTPKGRRIRGYKSLTAASVTTGVNVGSISKVVRGIGKTAGGFRWANS